MRVGVVEGVQVEGLSYEKTVKRETQVRARAATDEDFNFVDSSQSLLNLLTYFVVILTRSFDQMLAS